LVSSRELEGPEKLNFSELFRLVLGSLSIDLGRKFGTGGNVMLAAGFEKAGKEIALLYTRALRIEKWSPNVFTSVLTDFYKRLDVKCNSTVSSEHEITVVISDDREVDPALTEAYYNTMGILNCSMLFAVGLADNLRSPTSLSQFKNGRIQFRLRLDRAM
jgi:hypothetical protein